MVNEWLFPEQVTAPGLYWFADFETMSIVEIVKNPNGKLYIFYPGNESGEYLDDVSACRFIGPLEAPQHWISGLDRLT